MWADVDSRELPNYNANPRFSDNEDDRGGQLLDISERAHKLLIDLCTRSISHKKSKFAWSFYNLPRVVATKTPKGGPCHESPSPKAGYEC